MSLFFKWFFFLSKRLYKKATFLILLLLIPLTAIALKIASGESSGFVRVALVNKAEEDKFSEGLIDDLITSTSLIRFTKFHTEQEATEALNADKMDSIWIFPENIQEKMDRYSEGSIPEEGIVKVLIREDSVTNRMALERLSSTLYPYVSKKFFLHYIRTGKNFDLNDLSDQEIYDYYDQFHSDDPLFSFSYPDGSIKRSDSGTVHFLTAPIRGILSVIVVLCGMAAAMLFSQEEEKGTFAWAKPSSRLWISVASQAAAVLSTAVVMLFAVYLLGANVSFVREAGILFLFIINTTLFCTLLQQGIRRLSVLATTATVLTVLMLAVCPIFFDIRMFKIAQLLLPPTYYINSAYNNTYLLYSLIYSAAFSGLLFAVFLRRCHR